MMTIAELTKARAFADSIHGRTMDDSWSDAADWIRELADEVESRERALRSAQASEQAALADAARLTEENAILRTALSDLLENVGHVLKAVAL